MPLFAMISSCSMLFDSSLDIAIWFYFCQICNYYYLQSCHVLLSMLYCFLEIAQCSCFVMLYLYIMTMPFFSYCGTVECYFGVCNMPSCCFGQIVAITCLVCVCWTVAPFWVCSIWNLLDFACSFILSCCIHVLECFLEVCMHFASMPCLPCVAHIF